MARAEVLSKSIASFYMISGNKCPLCGKGRIIIDPDVDEYVCSRCGYVVPAKIINRGPEWRAFTKEERTSRKRTGPPASLTKAGRGLSTLVGRQPVDAHGKRLSAAAKMKFQRMQLWDTRSKMYTNKDRNLLQAMNLLSVLSDRLRLSDAVKEEAAYIYRKALSNKLIKGRSITGMIAASVYAACRNNRVPRTPLDIAKASNVKRKIIARFYRVLLHSLDIKVPIADPSRRVSRIATRVGLKEKTQRIALDIIEQARESGLVVGKNPMGLAAAALYTAALLEDEDVKQEEVAKAAGITSVTLRKRYADLKKIAESLC